MTLNTLKIKISILDIIAYFIEQIVLNQIIFLVNYFAIFLKSLFKN